MAEFSAALYVQVCYATPATQIVRDVMVTEGTILHDAIGQSGICNDAPEIDLTVWRVGIYGKLKQLDTVLRDRDRIEIYRPLLADPKEARRKRAMQENNGKPDRR